MMDPNRNEDEEELVETTKDVTKTKRHTNYFSNLEEEEDDDENIHEEPNETAPANNNNNNNNDPPEQRQTQQQQKQQNNKHEDDNDDNDNDDLNKLASMEHDARSMASHSMLMSFLQNGYSALAVFLLYLISLETILGCILSFLCTCYVYFREEKEDGWDGSSMDWVLLSFAVVTPMSASIGMAFTRREKALNCIARFRATSYQLYLAHACWDWNDSGNKNS